MTHHEPPHVTPMIVLVVALVAVAAFCVGFKAGGQQARGRRGGYIDPVAYVQVHEQLAPPSDLRVQEVRRGGNVT